MCVVEHNTLHVQLLCNQAMEYMSTHTCMHVFMYRYVREYICMSVIPTQVSMHEHVFLMSVCMCRSQEIHNY